MVSIWTLSQVWLRAVYQQQATHTQKDKNKTWEAKAKKYRQASEWKVKLIKVNK